MAGIGGAPPIRCRVRLASPPEEVYRPLATAEGRARFWAAEAPEVDGAVEFRFPGGERWRSRILERVPPSRFALEYCGGSVAVFDLRHDGKGGTDLALTESGVAPDQWADNRAGWVTVLLALKAALDFGVDLRNHDPQRTWQAGYVDV